MQFLAFRVEDLMRGLWASICQFLYKLLAWLYDLFFNISRVDLLNSDNIRPIYQRITMILAIIMVFYVTFEAVKYVVQPDQFSDKEKGASKLVMRMVIVVVLIAFVPNIFTWGKDFQNVIFDNQVFSKVILGKPSIDTDSYGRVFSSNILGMFYYPDENLWDTETLEEEDNCDDIPCSMAVLANLGALIDYGDIPLMDMGLTDGDENEEAGGIFQYYIHFDGLFAVIVGGFICYMLVLYCVDAGVRLAQLTFLQIIAPIPIIGYLSPKKDGIFQKWVKQCITTYLDLFIRVGIIYFVLLICQILSDAFATGDLFKNLPGNTDSTMRVFIYIALVMGLLLFAKKAPKMLQELFPKTGAASGNFGLKAGERVAPLVARTAGAAVGGGLAGAKGFISRTTGRIKRNRENRRRERENIEEGGESYKTTRNKNRSAYTEARRERNRLNKQIRNGEYMVEDLDANGNKQYDANGKVKMRKANDKEIQDAKRKANRDLKDARIAKEDAEAQYQNTKYRSALGSAVTGTVGGMVRGATSGAKATELKTIRKQVSEGIKKQDASTAKLEKWYDEGGGSNINRAITSIEKGLGIPTSTDAISKEIKNYSDQISSNETLIAAESDVKTKTDSAKDRSGSKLEKLEQKTTIGAEGDIKFKDINNQEQTVSGVAGLTTSQVYSKFMDETKKAESAADEASKEAQRTAQEAQRAAQEAAIDPNNTDKAKKAQEAAALARAAEMEASEKATTASTAKRNQEQVKKALEEYAITKILRNPNSSEHDPVLVDKIQTTKTSIEMSKRNSATLEKMKTSLGETSPTYQAYVTGNITSFKELDDIQTALINIANDRTRENMAIKETKRRYEASARTTAAKADNSAAGGK